MQGPQSEFLASNGTDLIAAPNAEVHSLPPGLRIVKSFEVLSVSDSSSGSSADTIPHKSEHTTNEKNSRPSVERWAGTGNTKWPIHFYTYREMYAINLSADAQATSP